MNQLQYKENNTTRNNSTKQFCRFDTMNNYNIKSTNQIQTSHCYGSNYQQCPTNNKQRSSSITKTNNNVNNQDKNQFGNQKKTKYSSQHNFDDFEHNSHHHNANGTRGKANNNNNNNNRKKPQLPEDAFYNPEKNMLYVKKGDNSESTMKTSINVILELDRTSSYSTNSSDEDVIHHTPRFRAGSMMESNQTSEFYEYSSPNVLPKNNKENSYRNRRQFKFFDIFYNGELVTDEKIESPKENAKISNKCYYYYGSLPYTSGQIFGGVDMKKGPASQLDVPSFLNDQ